LRNPTSQAGPTGTLGDLSAELSRSLRDAAADWATSRPRSRQVAFGPSGIGHGCIRHLTLGALHTPPSNPDPADHWPSTIGVAAHEVLAEALSKPGVGVRGTDTPPDDDQVADLRTQLAAQGGRWIVEQKLHIAPGLEGSCDAFDVISGVSLDHKVLGAASHRETRQNGPKQQYRIQANLYGFGWSRLGFDVRHVAIAAWPRSGYSTGLHMHIERYDEQLVEWALGRWYQVVEGAAGIAAQPALFDLLPTADGPCNWCPWHNPALAATDPSAACAGHPTADRKPVRPTIRDLIA
jgi:hypothetical protein